MLLTGCGPIFCSIIDAAGYCILETGSCCVSPGGTTNDGVAVLLTGCCEDGADELVSEDILK